MLSELTGASLEEVQESVNALWERMGFTKEKLSQGFNNCSQAKPHEFGFEGEANLRRAKAGYNNGIRGARDDAPNTVGGASKSNNHCQAARAMGEIIATERSIEFMLDAIDLQIQEIDERIDVIDERLAEIEAERAEARQTLERALDECPELARLMQEEGLTPEEALAQLRAQTEANYQAALQNNLSRAEAEAARDVYLEQTATWDSYERHLDEINNAIDKLANLSEEELALRQERGDLVMDKAQLEVLRDRLNDPELLAAIERGDITHQDLLDMMPKELQPAIMEGLTQRFQAGWEYGMKVVSNAYDNVMGTVNSATTSVRSWLSDRFSGATAATDQQTPAPVPEPELVAYAPAPAMPPAAHTM